MRGIGRRRNLRALCEGGHRTFGQRAVQRIGGGRATDQDQHDEAHALLPVIAAMREADRRAGEDQQRPNTRGGGVSPSGSR